MNWNTAKTWMIVALLILNAFLFVLLQMNRLQYELTDAEYRHINSVLEKNNISLAADIPRQFYPKRSLRIKPESQTDEQKKEMFLGSSAQVQPGAEEGTVLYAEGLKSLSISEERMLYTNPEGTGRIELTEEAAVKAASDYLLELGYRFNNFKFNQAEFLDGLIIVDFRELYQNEVIYNNYIRVTLSELGVVEVSCMYNSIVEFSGQNQKIASPDEALLSFLYNIHSIYVETEHLTIESMDIVYYQDVDSALSFSRATPHYRIYLQERSAPFLFNAFSLEMI